MPKHTPGPWKYHTEPQPNGCPTIGTANGLQVAMLSHSILHDDQRDVAYANAQLVSAAPDLLEALKAILPLAENGAATPGHEGACGPWASCDCECMAAYYDSEKLSLAYAAIRKAEENHDKRDT